MLYRGLALDAFQEQAITALEEGRSVLVSAPTGTGKTIIADWIVDEALRTGRRVIYTAPIKALSNQKYRDYLKLHGEERVGLVTGDLVIRREAPCLVMTTEILRNMLLAGDEIPDLLAVVLDEIHFLDDRERGTVWEEVLIYLPPEVRIVGLSATIANVDDFAAWLEHVRGGAVEVVREQRRAVPLETFYFSVETGLVAPEQYDRHFRRKGGRPQEKRGRGRGRGRDRRSPTRRTSHLDCFRALSREDLLPYLYFVFSRRDTEILARALARVLPETLLDHPDHVEVQARLDRAAERLGAILDPELRELYAKGVAFHHAGLHVELKTLVEELYEARLLKVLYCTSTFALGINMPARSVVFDGVKKFDGVQVAPLTTRGFMQKAGRAGRRGMDDRGHVVVRCDLEEYGELKPVLEKYRRGGYEPIRSTFNLSFHSIVALLERHPEARIKEIVEKSFLTWQNKRGGSQTWDEYREKVGFLKAIGYLDPDRGFNAGARILRHLQISEVFVTELVLDGVLEDLDPARLFGVLCGLTNELPRHVHARSRPTAEDRTLAHRIEQIRRSDRVADAAELSNEEPVWDPDVMLLGRRWAEGMALLGILELVESDTDVSGDLVTGFRRAKDLAGQLRDVYGDVPERVEMLSALLRRVSRDEVEVVG